VIAPADASLPTRHGPFRLLGFDGDHLALVRGDLSGAGPVLVRLHSECLTGDVFGSLRCDCGQQLDRALALIAERGRGVLLYLRQEGRGIGLLNKIRAYHLQDGGQDTVEANQALGFADDERDYRMAAEMLGQLGVRTIELITNNPRKVEGLERHGIAVHRIGLQVGATRENVRYLETKREKLGHLLR
jgi:GTP cyclohydrolase II